ncbi:thymidylate synthase [Geobacillus phage TP-84]|uniref:Thymidylate synthase n=1 Tax=Geobacillus phage TP-84 TaxID=1965361 RepID=A0A1U9WQN1_9CAUD|nr:thymidylate synthase [Geobacillus phage TP-84]AQY55086.1 thymidylate synthase [Geobacillus phage TP-84]
MEFKLYKVAGYEEAIMSLRMSKGKYFSWERAKKIQHLVYAVTDHRGFIAPPQVYINNMRNLAAIEEDIKVDHQGKKGEISGNYIRDVDEFKRLLALTLNNAMGEHKHHTLMKYIDISFFTIGLHRGAQDDLDAHAIAFNNRITRYSTRLANIQETVLSEWYQDKIIPFEHAQHFVGIEWPMVIETDIGNFEYTPFGYIHENFNRISDENGLKKDVKRGLIPLSMASNALWKIDLFNLRYVYKMRSKLTKANPELKQGMEMLADQIEKHVPVFGPYFRYELTDTGEWEHMNKVKTVTREEYELLKKIKKQMQQQGTVDVDLYRLQQEGE